MLVLISKYRYLWHVQTRRHRIGEEGTDKAMVMVKGREGALCTFVHELCIDIQTAASACVPLLALVGWQISPAQLYLLA